MGRSRCRYGARILVSGAAAAATVLTTKVTFGAVTEIPDTTPAWRRSAGTFTATVTSDAMSPAIEPGDVVYVHPEEIGRVGDDVLIGGKIRRLVEMTTTHWVTSSHNPPDTDYIRKADAPHPLKILAVDFAGRERPPLAA